MAEDKTMAEALASYTGTVTRCRPGQPNAPDAEQERGRAQFQVRVRPPGDNALSESVSAAAATAAQADGVAVPAMRPGAAVTDKGMSCKITRDARRGLEPVSRRSDRAEGPARHAGQIGCSCQNCGSSFVPQRRSARFCSPACRVAAHRARASVTGAAPRGATARAAKPATGTSGASRASQRSETTAADSHVTLSSNLGAGIVPDERWPGMWRIQFADGSLSSMVNLTRAKDRW